MTYQKFFTPAVRRIIYNHPKWKIPAGNGSPDVWLRCRFVRIVLFFYHLLCSFFFISMKLHTHCEERCFYLLWLQTRILVPKVRGKGSKIHSFALSRQQWKGKKKKSTHGFAQWTYVNFDKTNNLINSVFSFKFFLGSSFFFSSLGRKLNGFGKCREQVCVYFMRRSKTTEFSLFMIKVLENNK
jgi:hypothetical protein